MLSKRGSNLFGPSLSRFPLSTSPSLSVESARSTLHRSTHSAAYPPTPFLSPRTHGVAFVIIVLVLPASVRDCPLLEGPA
ncbi:hypothetical protein BDQ12DRAFT_687391 [Crucibulum laeve]|uniref:Uncharacterized protein n=1 Tax=Crucibulum laeve TaxID=68775 RepID=A0A5C3LT24_9AGAR|nr:hypothetical protein BDQ12DRAFT_687391 [Crucibulum laeve]